MESRDVVLDAEDARRDDGDEILGDAEKFLQLLAPRHMALLKNVETPADELEIILLGAIHEPCHDLRGEYLKHLDLEVLGRGQAEMLPERTFGWHLAPALPRVVGEVEVAARLDHDIRPRTRKRDLANGVGIGLLAPPAPDLLAVEEEPQGASVPLADDHIIDRAAMAALEKCAG